MSNNHISWIQKYKPQKISEIVCNESAIKFIQNWLTEFERIKIIKVNESKNKISTRKKIDNMKSCLLITGKHGIGKTLTINIILKEYNYNIQTIDFGNIRTSKSIEEYINKIIHSSNIVDMINKNEYKKIAIIVDELETITSTIEKNSILTLQRLNDIHWFCPIIFISDNQHNKLLSDIKKNSLEIKFWPPTMYDLRRILINIINLENIKIKDEEVIEKLIIHSQSDIRRLIYTIQDISCVSNKKIITKEIINEYCTMSKKKDIDMDLFKATQGLFYNYKNIDNCIKYYEIEKVLLPLMVHQNYAKHILVNIVDINKKFEIMNKVAESLSIGDVIENYIYGDQNWDMQEIHGFYTCVVPSFYLCRKIDNNQALKIIDLEFPLDLNKTSIKKINKKNIINTSQCFRNMNIFDYIYINKIIRKLINNGKIKECVEILKNYNIKVEHIESLLKIDKIRNTKVSLLSKQKKEFLKYLNI